MERSVWSEVGNCFAVQVTGDQNHNKRLLGGYSIVDTVFKTQSHTKSTHFEIYQVVK